MLTNPSTGAEFIQTSWTLQVELKQGDVFKFLRGVTVGAHST
jgi:hypothetical protein